MKNISNILIVVVWERQKVIYCYLLFFFLISYQISYSFIDEVTPKEKNISWKMQDSNGSENHIPWYF